MTPDETQKNAANVCNLNYLNEMMGGKNHLITGIIDSFLIQIQEELLALKEAIEKTNYTVIKSFAHTMKSSVSIMGITVLAPILQEMENLALQANDIEKINKLYTEIAAISKKAVEEIEIERKTYL